MNINLGLKNKFKCTVKSPSITKCFKPHKMTRYMNKIIFQILIPSTNTKIARTENKNNIYHFQNDLDYPDDNRCLYV